MKNDDAARGKVLGGLGPKSGGRIKNDMEKPEKYYWKKSYTAVLVANAAYVMIFYFLMTIFS